MRRVLVTGADGSIGRAAVTGLREAGYDVTGLSLRYDHASTADRRLIGDARSTVDVAAALDGVDAVLHLAAIPHPSLGTPEEVFENNVAATFNVLSQAGQRGIGRVVIASSINAFGVPMNVNPVVPAYYPLDEEVHVDISDAYSLSKSVDEQSARMAWRRWGINVIALRFPLVKTREQLQRFAANAERDPSTMAREGWAYLDLRDGVRAVIAALESPATGAHVVGLAADDILIDRPTDELLREYAPTVPVRRAVVGRDALVDTSRARELLGFTPQYSIHSTHEDHPEASRTPAPPRETRAM